MRRKNGIDERRLAQASLTYEIKSIGKSDIGAIYMSLAAMDCWLTPTNNDHIKLEAAFQELVLNLLRDGVESDI